LQKYNKKASVLIWAIFLSLMISISFLSVATKISKNLNSTNSLKKNIFENIQIQNKLNSIKLNSATINEKIKINIENKTLKKSLKKYEIFTINFPENSDWSLNLTSSGIIYYTFWSDKWFLDNTNTKYEFSNKNWDLTLENYSWITKFKLSSDKKFDFDWKKYKIIENFQDHKIVKQSWILK